MSVRYPAHREADIVLRDGSTAHVRPVRAEDEPALLAFYTSLSPESVQLRFFSGGANLQTAARWGASADYVDHYGIVATMGVEHSIIAHASYVRTGPDRAEVGLEVADAAQGHGLGTLLLGHIAEAAQEHHINIFEGRVLWNNHKMIDVFRASGFPVRTRAEPGEVVFEFPTSLTADALSRFEAREQLAAAAAMHAFLSPHAIAVIGAGRERGTIGGELFHNLLAAGFTGPVYPVNPKADVVQSVVAYPTIAEVPGVVDLAVIVVPAAAVLDAARECALKGVRALVVISAGFSEVGGNGSQMQRDLVAICREAGMRLIGPNCMGIINTAPDVRMNATFVPLYPPHGRVGFSSQSGALGLAVIDYAASLGLGISSFVSVGNKADISGNDLINYWETDDDTDLIMLYLESFGNPRKFARVARRAGKRKPIIAVKSGRSPAGARATSSHTGAMLAASDITVDALFTQAGVIRTDTLAEMFDVASLLANQPPPAGRRVAIITNAGGPGILCADACEAAGLQLPALPEELRAHLATFLPPAAAISNPVDMIASATGEDYRRTIEAVASSGAYDAVIVIFIPPLVTRAEEVATAVRTAAEHSPRGVAMLSVFMSSRGVPSALRDEHVRIPSYAFPEDAARALARAARYGEWRAQPDGVIREYGDARQDEASAVIAGALERGPGWMSAEEIATVLDCYGLPLAEQRIARSAKGAGAAAQELGGRVALKALGPGLLHKTEAGGVRLDLKGAASVAVAARDMRARLAERGERVDRFLVQRMASPGVEALVGVVADPVFGPVVAVGAGGTAVELLKDVQVRIAPLTEQDASTMIRSLRTFPLFDGYRGTPKVDVGALEDVILRVSAMVEAHTEIAEMDLNPVIVQESGTIIVDARIRLEPLRPRLPVGAARPA